MYAIACMGGVRGQLLEAGSQLDIEPHVELRFSGVVGGPP